MSLQSNAEAGDGRARNNVVRLERERREKGSDREGRDEIFVDMSGMVYETEVTGGVERRPTVGKVRARDDAGESSTSREYDERD